MLHAIVAQDVTSDWHGSTGHLREKEKPEEKKKFLSNTKKKSDTNETRRALRERRPPPRPSHILNNKYKLDKNKLKKWKVLSWQLNNSNFMELSDRIYEEF